MSVGEVIGPYQVVSVVGEGGFGRVVIVRNEKGEEYAMKIARQEQRSEVESLKLSQLFLNEIASLKASDHENIVELIEIFHSTSNSNYRNCYIVMEKCDTDLHHWLRADGNLKKVMSERDTCWILSQVACALSSMRQNDFLHRDLKPPNLLLKLRNANTPKLIQSYTIKIGDFGLARTLRDDEEAHTILGTKHYIAPETMGCNYNSSVDIYSFGVIACELITGEIPKWHTTSKSENATDLEEILSRHPTISPAAKSFLRGTITYIDSRMSWSEFFTHPWLLNDIGIQRQTNYIRQHLNWVKSINYLLDKIIRTSPVHTFYIALWGMEICHKFLTLKLPADQEPKEHGRWLQAIAKGLAPKFSSYLGSMLSYAHNTQHSYGKRTSLFKRLVNEDKDAIPHFAGILFEEIIHLKKMAVSFETDPDMEMILHARRCLYLVQNSINSESNMTGDLLQNEERFNKIRESNMQQIQLLLEDLWNVHHTCHKSN